MPAHDASDAPPDSTRALAGRLLRGAPLPSPTPHLRVLTGPAAGTTAPLAAGLTLGRGAEASCRVEDPAASRLHARVERRGGAEVLVDLGSKNGLRLNGRRLRRARRLRHGDRIALGTTELLVVSPPPGRAARSAVAPPEAAQGARPGLARARRFARPLLAAALLGLAAALWLLG